MVPQLFNFLIIFVICLLGVLIYVSYLPFKWLLLKSGKINNEQNKNINRTYTVSIFLIAVVIYAVWGNRDSSIDRVEKISDIHLPENYKVLKDDYQNVWPSFALDYDIKLSKSATSELIKSIEASKYYNISDSNLTEAKWTQSAKGYRFSGTFNAKMHEIEFDTISNIFNPDYAIELRYESLKRKKYGLLWISA